MKKKHLICFLACISNFAISAPYKSNTTAESLCRQAVVKLLKRSEKDLIFEYGLKHSEILPGKLLAGSKYTTLQFVDANTKLKYEAMPLFFGGKVIAVTMLFSKDQIDDLGVCNEAEPSVKSLPIQIGSEECRQVSPDIEAVVRRFETSSHVVLTHTKFSLRPAGMSASRAEIFSRKPCE